METTTVIELFEELKKQIAALARRLDDRNPPAPPVSSIPTEPDNRLDRLLETARHTRTNVERVRMELTDRISALEKKLGQECGKCAALPSPQRHIHTIDFKSSKSTLCMFGLSLAVVCCGVHIHRLHDRIDSICDAELKYRYIRMKGEASSERIAELEDIFEWNRDDDKIRQLKKNVEQYERTIQQRIALDEQIRLKGQEVEQLDEKAKKLRGK
ncbi:DUF342 domain-containing protein [Alistipes dispar]|uniref:Uncharacterized protein n=1 Tax=Alistipes dispar TaxID=2585119 RepID=A0A4Y1X169_9BACT|nr:DUF342 domain-containing protein [Alistipes dispar]BBL06880.1 hypothetical protein A5CPEGH6_15180 [Alistipes dispar]